MFPPLTQRILIAVSAVAGGAVAMLATGALGGRDGFTGISLLSAQVSPAAAVIIAVAVAVPAVALGLLCAWRGHAMAGVFVPAVGLTTLACLGGSSEGWLWRSELPGAYASLMLESLIWTAFWAALVIPLAWVKRGQVDPAPAAQTLLPRHPVTFGLPDANAWLAGGLCAAIAGAIAWFLLATAQTGQTVGGLIVAFAVAACVSQLLFPKVTNPLPMLAAPLLVALVGYGWMLYAFDASTPLLRDWHHHGLPGLALALPIHYASAAMVGLSVGIGWAHGIIQNQTAQHPGTRTAMG